jgi:hypothetical protein
MCFKHVKTIINHSLGNGFLPPTNGEIGDGFQLNQTALSVLHTRREQHVCRSLRRLPTNGRHGTNQSFATAESHRPKWGKTYIAGSPFTIAKLVERTPITTWFMIL